MYYVHKFSNLSSTTIHLGTHPHLVTKGMCKEYVQEMENTIAYEVYCTLTTTSSTTVLSARKTFLFCHLFHGDGKGLVELLKGKKLNQKLLKFAPLCSPNIQNLIVSLKHCPDNSSSLNVSSNWKHCLVTIIFKIIVSWSIGWAKGLFVQIVHQWSCIQIWFGLANATEWRFTKCMDDVRLHKTCSRMDDHGLSCLWPNLL